MRRKGRVELAAIACATQFTDGMRLITEFNGGTVQPELAKFVTAIYKQAYCVGHSDGAAEGIEKADMATQDLEQTLAEIQDALAPYQPSDFEQSLVEAPRTLAGQIQRCIEWSRMAGSGDSQSVDPIESLLVSVRSWAQRQGLPEPASVQYVSGELLLSWPLPEPRNGRAYIKVDRQSEGVRFKAEDGKAVTDWFVGSPRKVVLIVTKWLAPCAGGEPNAG